MVQNMIDAIRAARGVPSINHPNYGWAISADELGQVQRTRLFEVFNGHPLVNNLGGGGVPGLEETWDRILSSGKLLYGIAVDDAHYFKRPEDKTVPRPGFGWVLRPRARGSSRARSSTRSSAAISIRRPASSCSRSTRRHRRMTIAVATERSSKYRIQFIGRQGRVLSETTASPATYTFKGDEGYVRAKVIESNGKLAWIQPVPVGASAPEMTPIVVVAAIIERDGCFLVTLGPTARTSPGTGNFPAARSTTARRTSRRCAAKCSRSSMRWWRSASSRTTVTHAYPEKTVQLFFYRCGLHGEPKPMMGQEMRWVAQERAGALPFPEADRDLITLLS